jgi:ubiquinone/menaquinone biosynthesis C-methylase UbiE
MSGSHDITSYSRRLQDETRAELYAKRFESGSRRRIDKREQHAVRKIFAGLKSCHSVLDVPSGAGRFINTLSQGGRRVIEADVAFEILEYAQSKAVKLKIDAQALQGDAARLPLTSGAVDCVFSNRLLHHIHASSERKALLKEFHRVSRRYAVVSFFNYKGLAQIRSFLKRLKGRVPPYANQPTQDEFREEVRQCGFNVQAVVPTGMPWVSQKYFVLEKA